MAASLRLICAAAELTERGKGVRFEIERYGRPTPAFVIRYNGRPHAFINECAHVPVQLDWQPGEFFDDSGLYLICSVHGALYSPESGRCMGGRCNGRGLKPLPVNEHDGNIYLEEQKTHG